MGCMGLAANMKASSQNMYEMFRIDFVWVGGL